MEDPVANLELLEDRVNARVWVSNAMHADVCRRDPLDSARPAWGGVGWEMRAIAARLRVILVGADSRGETPTTIPLRHGTTLSCLVYASRSPTAVSALMQPLLRQLLHREFGVFIVEVVIQIQYLGRRVPHPFQGHPVGNFGVGDSHSERMSE